MDKSIPKQPLHTQCPKECIVSNIWLSVLKVNRNFAGDGQKHYVHVSLQAPCTQFMCQIPKAEPLVGNPSARLGKCRLCASGSGYLWPATAQKQPGREDEVRV